MSKELDKIISQTFFNEYVVNEYLTVDKLKELLEYLSEKGYGDMTVYTRREDTNLYRRMKNNFTLNRKKYNGNYGIFFE